MDILCSLRNINLSFGDKPLFRDASLTIHRGERIGLLGLNGKGKSTLLRILTEEIEPDQNESKFKFDKSKDEENPFSVFMVPQEMPEEATKKATIEDFIFHFYPELGEIHNQLQEVNRVLEISSESDAIGTQIESQKTLLERFEFLGGWELTQSYKSYLKYFGIEEFDTPMKNLSGGEQKKVLLSLGLSCKDNLVLWDEPTNHLDIETIKLYEGELQLKDNAYILITHDRYLLAKLTNKIFHLTDGKISMFNGGYQEYLVFLDQEEEYRTRLLDRMSNTLRREEAWMRQGIKARGCRSKKRVENYEELKKSIASIRNEAKQELSLSIKDSKRKSKKLITVKNGIIGYDAEALLSNINLEVFKGDKIGLLGPNGSGKSSLVNAISEKIKFISGEIKRADNLTIQHFTQKREELDESKTPFELLGDGSDHVLLPNGKSLHVITYFERFLFDKNNINRPLTSFSGGERNRLQMAINFTKDADLWIFDEPTNDLDLETLKIIEQNLIDFKGSLILISHDRTFLSNITNKIWMIHNEEIEALQAGYSDAQKYLDTLELSKGLPEEEEKKVEPKEITPKKKNKKVSNKDKIRLKEIKDLIPIQENKIVLLEKEILAFDFANMDSATSQNLNRLQHQKDEKEEELLALYEELEEIESKIS